MSSCCWYRRLQGPLDAPPTNSYTTRPSSSPSSGGLPVVVVNPAQVRAFARRSASAPRTDPLDAAVESPNSSRPTKPPLRPYARDGHTASGRSGRAARSDHRDDGGRTPAPEAADRKAYPEEHRPSADSPAEGTFGTRCRHRRCRSRLAGLARQKRICSRPSPGSARSSPGTLIAELPELGTLDRRRIAALAGLAPWTRQSGQWKGKSFIGGGRARVRAALFMGAMVADST